ncbi:hypothetical protein [Lignipirellula cremea]|uniref:Uncharacterized protein n=1 Tax=Lignipirellula cremea TaxID=2528010 RepID=A0A518E0A6_9BACT|nr:hypothetical protein [Lignipirellula cremea]QDU97513.1 hypothetical protein Pla8534_53610 [Lignipirellula cremea]
MSYLFNLLPDSTTGVKLPPGRKSLGLWDTDASHLLRITPGSNLTAHRSLTWTTGDADRNVTISGDAVISQDYSTTGTPRFGAVGVGTVPTGAAFHGYDAAGTVSVYLDASTGNNSAGFQLRNAASTANDRTLFSRLFSTHGSLPDAFLQDHRVGGSLVSRTAFLANGNGYFDGLNWGLGQTTFDATGTKVFVIGNGTAPAAGLANASQFYSKDFGSIACPTFKMEDGTEIILNQNLSTASSPAFAAVTGRDASGTNTAGANLTIQPGQSTGNATPASIQLQYTAAGSSGSTAQSLVTGLTFSNALLTFADAVNVAFNTTTGTNFGTATGQKLGFWNATPVVQQVLATGAGATVDNVISLLQTLGLCRQS